MAKELAVRPESFIYSSRFGFHELAPAAALTVYPLANVEIAVCIDVPPVAVVNVVLELALVDDVVDLLADTLNATISTKLTNDELVVL